MDALVAAAIEHADGRPARVVIVPTAAARQRPDLAATTGERAFLAAARRAGATVRIDVARILTRPDAEDRETCDLLAAANLVHLPGGDPDLIPAVLRGTTAWANVIAANARGACVAGASAGAMALAERLWTPAGGVAGLGLVAGLAVLPHFAPDRLVAWRPAVDDDGAARTWLGLDEQTMVIGRSGESWMVVGRGEARLLPPGGPPATRTARHGMTVRLR